MGKVEAPLGFNIYPAQGTGRVDRVDIQKFLKEKGWRSHSGGEGRDYSLQLLGYIDEEQVGKTIRELKEKIRAQYPGAKVEILHGDD